LYLLAAVATSPRRQDLEHDVAIGGLESAFNCIFGLLGDENLLIDGLLEDRGQDSFYEGG